MQEQIADPEHIGYLLRRVEQEIAELRSHLSDRPTADGYPGEGDDENAKLSAGERLAAGVLAFLTYLDGAAARRPARTRARRSASGATRSPSWAARNKACSCRAPIALPRALAAQAACASA